MGLSLSLEQGHEGRIREVLQEDCCSSTVCTVIYASSYCNVMYPHIMLYCCAQGTWFVILIDVYFSQVKNKPWLPWVYSWIWHHRKQLRWVWSHVYKLYFLYLGLRLVLNQVQDWDLSKLGLRLIFCLGEYISVESGIRQGIINPLITVCITSTSSLESVFKFFACQVQVLALSTCTWLFEVWFKTGVIKLGTYHRCQATLYICIYSTVIRPRIQS